jgi:hypothetical protein
MLCFIRLAHGVVRIVCLTCTLTLLPWQVVTADGPAETGPAVPEVVFVYLEPVHVTPMLPPRSIQLFPVEQHLSGTYPMVGSAAEERGDADLQVPRALIRALLYETRSTAGSGVELQVPAALLTTQSAEGQVQSLPPD